MATVRVQADLMNHGDSVGSGGDGWRQGDVGDVGEQGAGWL